MKWYSKQLKALKKATGLVVEADTTRPQQSLSRQKSRGNTGYRDPMAQRNLNRSKTDSAK